MKRPIKSRPTLDLEQEAGGRVVGVDEVGRGPLSGPVVAAAVILPRDLPAKLADLLDDSKKLRPVAREAAYAALLASGAEIGLAAASVADIARLNILHASMLAMRRAVNRLPSPPDLALIDGNRVPKLECPSRSVVGGDAKSLSIAAASIVAKVVRDRLMTRLDARYPGYGWAENAGYGTPFHLEGLARLGATPHHRKDFAPVAAAIERSRSD